MPASFSDATASPVIIPTGKPSTPFTKVAVNESSLPATEIISVRLSDGYSYPNSASDLGSLSDPLGGGSYDATTHTFTETAIATGTPTSATMTLQRLIYTPPTLPAGSYETVTATITDADGTSGTGRTPVVVTDPSPVIAHLGWGWGAEVAAIDVAFGG